MLHHRRGFTLVEVTIVSGLTAFLAILLSSAWMGMSRSTVDLVGRGRLIQELDMAVASLSRDLGGSLAVASSSNNLGRGDTGAWINYEKLADPQYGDKLRLYFDGGDNPSVKNAPNTVIEYHLESYDESPDQSSNVLVRQENPDDFGEKFVVAKNVDSMNIIVPEAGFTGDGFIEIELTFKYHYTNGEFTRKCALKAKIPPQCTAKS
jgi:type II secretory pathway pseudopilin PulG